MANKKEVKNSECILNIAAGNLPVLNDLDKKFDKYFMISNDISYFNGSEPEDIEDENFKWVEEKDYNIHMVCTMDIFEFLSRTLISFDRICVYRFLEHVKRVDVLYFIYLLSRVTRKDAIVDVIVPNYKTLAQRILDEDTSHRDFEKEDILTTTEVLNEKEDPHCSIWTKHRVERFFTLEDRFAIIDDIKESFEYDGRDIYIRALLRRI